MRLGILGGGLSGITLQKLLKESSEVLEKENRIGGLCRSFVKNGFLYDVGGHILFSRDDKIMDLVREILGENKNYCKRDSKIFFKERFVKYPFENDLAALDKEDIYECLMGYIKNEHPNPKNLKEWIYYTFGSGIADKYLIPYNEKIWKTKLEEMTLEWVERIPKPPMEDVIKSALGIETEGYTHQLYFNYPIIGGIEALVSAMVKEKASICTSFDIKRIYLKGKNWVVSNGTDEKEYEKLVLTFSVKEAVKIIDNVPEKVKEAAANLRNNMVRVVLVGVNNESLSDRGAIYVPSSDICTHRVCYMNYFSKNNVPKGKSSLMAEVTTNPNQEYYNVSNDVLVEKVINDLSKAGMIRKNEVVETDIKNFEYGYVVYDLDYQKNIKIVRDYFKEIGIDLHGRFAEFEYINMDEVIKRSINLAEKINSPK
ncbi:MAG: FAD-dependent oxidoreductase [Candidatus Margulisiibacteriota bacterium]|jgi:protoporphyrinogen oxidase